MEELYDLKMSNIKNDVSELNDAEGSDNSKYMNTRIFCKIAMMLININNRLTELNQILGHKSGIDQPDGWDSSKNQKDTEDSIDSKKLEDIAEWVCTESLSFERLRNDVSDIKNANESGNMVVPENVISDIDGLRNDVDDLSQQVDDLRGDVEYKSNEDHEHDEHPSQLDLEDLENRIDDKISQKISSVKKDFSEPKNVTITWREDE